MTLPTDIEKRLVQEFGEERARRIIANWWEYSNDFDFSEASWSDIFNEACVVEECIKELGDRETNFYELTCNKEIVPLGRHDGYDTAMEAASSDCVLVFSLEELNALRAKLNGILGG